MSDPSGADLTVAFLLLLHPVKKLNRHHNTPGNIVAGISMPVADNTIVAHSREFLLARVPANLDFSSKNDKLYYLAYARVIVNCP